MWLTRRHLLPLIAAGLAGLPAAPPHAATPPRLPSGRLALNGFDVVSYFLGAPEVGSPNYEIAWGGRTWRFARAGNRDAFARDPESYAPRLGGFDPIGMVAGRIVDTDPLVFARLPGPDGVERLYLLRNDENRSRLIGDPGIAERAETEWPALRNQVDRDFSD